MISILLSAWVADVLFLTTAIYTKARFLEAIMVEVKRPQSGASAQDLSLKKRVESWLAHQQQVAVETLIRLLQNPFSSVLTWLVIAIALTLPGALWMALDNTAQLSNQFQASGRKIGRASCRERV